MWFARSCLCAPKPKCVYYVECSARISPRIIWLNLLLATLCVATVAVYIYTSRRPSLSVTVAASPRALPQKETPQTELCQFQADAGYVFAPASKSDDGITVVPFPQCSDALQRTTSEHIFREWGKDLQVSSVDECLAIIRRQWSTAGDSMYVMSQSAREGHAAEFIGCVAVDRKQFYPYISHLYVHPDHRKRGFGQQLVEHGVKHAAACKFSEVKLWCERKLLPFYEGLGWRTEAISDNKYIMVRGVAG